MKARLHILYTIVLVCLTFRSTNSWQIRPHKRRPHPAVWLASVTDEDSTSATSPATLRSITFCNIPKDQEPDVLADFLLELGACSAAVTDADAGTALEQPLFSEPGATPWQDSLHWAAPVWNRCNVTAHFGASTDLAWMMEMVQESFPDHQFPIPDGVTNIPDRDWVVHVQSSWKPIVVGGKFVLRFPWHTEKDVAQALKQVAVTDDTTVQLFLQGGIAFGTGEHPTTQLCLQWLDRTLQQHSSTSSSSLRILDYGAGSGVLGLAACKLCPSATATGVDIDVDACRIANQNALDNNVPMRNYLPPLWLESADEGSKALWLQAHAQVHSTRHQRGDGADEDALSILWPEEEPSDGFDVCVANILAGPLITLAPTLQSMMRAGAPIGMSGILAHQGTQVVEAFTEAGFLDMQVTDELDGWVLVTGRKADTERT
eukprot:scaffold8450_cov215-Amphora_coffeaeformis.AAC.10